MQIASDTMTSLTPNPDERFFWSRDVSKASTTFLKPRLRLAVAPRTGELRVQVELSEKAQN